MDFSVWANVWPKHPILGRFCVIEAWKYLFWPWTIRQIYGGAVVTASVTLEGTSGISLRPKMIVYNQTWAQSEIYQPVYVFAFSCKINLILSTCTSLQRIIKLDCQDTPQCKIGSLILILCKLPTFEETPMLLNINTGRMYTNFSVPQSLILCSLSLLQNTPCLIIGLLMTRIRDLLFMSLWSCQPLLLNLFTHMLSLVLQLTMVHIILSESVISFPPFWFLLAQVPDQAQQANDLALPHAPGAAANEPLTQVNPDDLGKFYSLNPWSSMLIFSKSTHNNSFCS